MELFQRFHKAIHSQQRLYWRSRIALVNQLLVKKIANQLLKKTNSHHICFDDLMQEGSIGLLKAIDKFDPARAAFSSFAVPYIRGEMMRFLRDRADLVRIPRKWQDKQTLINRLLAAGATLPEIAKETKLDVAELKRAIAALRRLPQKNIDDVQIKSRALADYRRLFTEMGLQTLIEDGYLDGTQLCQSTGKKIYDFLRSRRNQQIINEIAIETGIPASKLVRIRRGRNACTQVHWKVGIVLAAWCSPKMSAIVADWAVEGANNL